MPQHTRGLARSLTVIVVGLALSIGMGGPILAGRANAAPSETGARSGIAGTKVTTADLNLRSAPSLDAPIVRVTSAALDRPAGSASNAARNTARTSPALSMLN